MKPNASRFTIGAVALVIGFIVGFIVDSARSGYHLEVISEEEYPFPMGSVHRSLISESVGMTFLDPETTTIKWNGRTIFKVQRDFQEKTPVVGNLKTSDSTIEWDDGEYHFNLAISKLPSPPPK